MKKTILTLAAVIVSAGGAAYAQSYAPDAYRFSQGNYGSTARFKGMGGAQIGVGGDLSSLGGNPAGLGLFTKSEFSLTPEFNSANAQSSFLGTNTKDSKSQLNLNNIGVVFYSPTYKAKGADTQKGLVSAVFGVGYNRNNDYLNQISYNGTNANSSIRDAFAEQANSFGTNGTLAGDAYNSYLINRNATNYPGGFSAEPYNNANFPQSWNENRLGSTSEFNVAGALNFSNKFYLGGAISFVDVRYISDAFYSESGIANPFIEGTGGAAGFYEGNQNYTLNYIRNQETKGSGVNLKIGMIFRPVSELRIGLNFQSPTWMNVQDNTNETLNARVGSDTYNNNSQNYTFTYNLKTPLKASAGLSYVLAGRALLSADVDYIDYSTMRFSADGGSDIAAINQNNADIKDFYKSTVNYRFGAEVKVTNEFSLRGGYGVNGSGIKGGDDSYYQGQYFTGGLGYRIDNYYFDLAYQNYKTNFSSSPYELNDFSEPVADVKSTRQNVFLTFGVRF